MKKIYITRRIPDAGIKMLQDKGYEIDINPENRVHTEAELLEVMKKKEYDAVITLLTDTVDKDMFDACPTLKIVANYAVGYNNIDLEEAKKRGVTITNTPGQLTETVGEYTVALLLTLSKRILEADAFIRAGKYKGWDPMLMMGADLFHKTAGILGAGRIGYHAANILKKGLMMDIVYYDVKRNEMFEKDFDAKFCETPEEVLKVSDVVSIHVPLLDSTHHLINKERLAMMKKSAYLINTSRGPVVDEAELVEALKNGVIAGAGLDVFEHEPELAPGLVDLPNVVLTPHIASATQRARDEMATLAAQNVIDFLEGGEPKNKVVV
jgi:glyoxylate reductase